MRLTLPLFLLLFTGLHAQDCFYQLQLTDAGGDGWNGAAVTVSVDDVSTVYTLDATNDDGARRDFFFPVTEGAEVRIGFRAGAFPDEVSFAVLDNADTEVYSVQAPATNATLTTFTAACVACAPPPLTSIELYRVRYNSVDLRFRNAPGTPVYLVTYGEAGFDPDGDAATRLETRDTMLRISGLEPTTDYDFYLLTQCADDEESIRRGPFRISTPRRRDIGVTELVSPVSDCDRTGSEQVTIGITNFGGEAQQFVRLNYSVNGVPGGVTYPNDGIYTGVIGVDSTKYFTFDAQADLTTPGYYEIKAWTLLEGDEVSGNDTLTAAVVTLPVIAEFPYVETFESGIGYWLPSSDGQGPISWARARPRGPRIDRAGDGAYAFVTNAAGPYNDNELSYLSSPCFDFSGLAADPTVSFLLYVDTEAEFDGLYLQATTDGGDSWRRVDRNATGVNWYNNGVQRQWDGDGGFGGGYALVQQQLTGFAGRDHVRFRFVFESDAGTQREGVAIDNFRITPAQELDYAAVAARLFNAASCDERTDTLAFTYVQLGTQAVDSVTVAYALNGGAETSLRAPAPQVRGTRATFRFPVPVTVPNIPNVENRITLRVSATGDGATYNDTLVYVYPPVEQLPFLVDFEDGRRPAGWDIPTDLTIARRAGTPSLALTDNLNASDTEMRFTTARYGTFTTADEVTFTLRVRDANGDPAPNALDRLLVTYTSDCADVATVAVDLSTVPADSVFTITGLSGNGYRFEFQATGGAQDVFVTFDDIGVRRCPADLNLRYTLAPPSGIYADDGTAYVLAGAGLPPYTYAWSNGDTTQSADSLSVADYSVTVTDAVGCIDELSLTVDLTAVSTTDPEGLLTGLSAFPNPTSGRLEVRLELPGAERLGLELFDATGRRLEVRDLGLRDRLAEGVDLTGRPTGLYFLRLTAGAASRTLRVTKR